MSYNKTFWCATINKLGVGLMVGCIFCQSWLIFNQFEAILGGEGLFPFVSLIFALILGQFPSLLQPPFPWCLSMQDPRSQTPFWWPSQTVSSHFHLGENWLDPTLCTSTKNCWESLQWITAENTSSKGDLGLAMPWMNILHRMQRGTQEGEV